MATVLDNKLRKKAYDLIQRYGKDALVVVVGNAQFNITDGAVDRKAPTEHAQKVVLDKYSAVEADGEAIKLTDTKCFLADYDPDTDDNELAFEPSTDMQVKLVKEDELFTIVKANRHYTGEQVGLWELQLRR